MAKRRDDIPINEVRKRLAAGEQRKDIARSYGMSASSFAHWCRGRGIDKGVGNLAEDERSIMPSGLDVRILPEFPHLLFGADGKLYSDRFDPPREMQLASRGDGRLRIKHGSEFLSVAREMCRAWHGEPGPNEVTHYRDQDRANVCPDNLYWSGPAQSVSAEAFVRAWQSSESIAEVCDKLAITTSAAVTRAGNFRDHGVPLKDLRINSRDWDALAELAKSLESPNGNSE